MKRKSLWSIEGNSQKLDGGAMFGNAPKAVWRRWIEPDEHNRIPLACRSLLVQEKGGRLLLFETGIGVFFEPKLRARFGVVEAEHMLLKNLRAAGFDEGDVDVVVLSHLHFDHAGGLLTPWSEAGESALCFPNAEFIVSAEAWERACQPHPRDRASFIPQLQHLLEESGRLQIVQGTHAPSLGVDYRLHYSQGHTPGLMLTEITGERGAVLFCGDLIPGAPWVHLPITMGYDRFPERLIDEKTALLEELSRRDTALFFTHDAGIALGRFECDGRGRYGVTESVKQLSDYAL